ncbi:hypothetical protein [Aureimonas ureilytica]|uniref:hypothetical protein n=1 Tax=Aureimonas ureilytica TaxID=401562 RepID=UPI0007346C57|nr:hypothetical protein [Aureimonas ureilytica]
MSALKTLAAFSAIAGLSVTMHGWREGYDLSPPAAPSVAMAAEPSGALVAQAQTSNPAPAQAPTPPPTQVAPSQPASNEPAAAPPQVDLTALRYFAQQGDTRRLEAEIARLKSLYPNWQPPENPFDLPAAAPAGDPELDRIWQLYAQGRLGEVREAIAARTESQPGWQPPADLLERIAVAEARLQLVNASNLQQYESVIRIAASTPSLLTCSEVDSLWRVARAFAETKRPERAKDAYLYVLTHCDNTGERLATIQMASQRLARADLDPLLAAERIGPDGVGEFAALRADLARASLAKAADDASVQVSDADLALIRKLVDAPEGRASDAELLGWYALRRGDAAGALPNFERARAREDSATISQGYALSLIPLGRFAEAEGAMAPWRTASDGARAVYLAAAANLLAASGGQIIQPDVLARITAAVGQARDGASAQQLGWYAYGLNQFATAGQWFAAALDFRRGDEPSAYGLALVRQRLGDQPGLAALQRAFGARSPRIAAIGRPDQAEVAAAQAARDGATVPPTAYAAAQPGVSAQALAGMAGAGSPFARAPSGTSAQPGGAMVGPAGTNAPAAGFAAAQPSSAMSGATQMAGAELPAAGDAGSQRGASMRERPAAAMAGEAGAGSFVSAYAGVPSGARMGAGAGSQGMSSTSPQPGSAIAQSQTPPATRRAHVAPSARSEPAASAPPARRAGSRSAPARGCGGAEIDPSTLSPDAAMARGWCLLDLNRPLEAAGAFESAARRGEGRTRQDASYGESLAYLRLGVGDRAAIAATRSPQPAARRIELDTAILSARATSAFEAKRPVETLQALDERARIAPERLDLMVLRGYAYLELRRWADARQVFSAVARTGNREGVRGLAALDQAQGRFPNDG